MRSTKPHRSALLRLLCKERVEELTCESRVVVLDALQKMRVDAHAEGWVAACVRACVGEWVNGAF